MSIVILQPFYQSEDCSFVELSYLFGLLDAHHVSYCFHKLSSTDVHFDFNEESHFIISALFQGHCEIPIIHRNIRKVIQSLKRSFPSPGYIWLLSPPPQIIADLNKEYGESVKIISTVFENFPSILLKGHSPFCQYPHYLNFEIKQQKNDATSIYSLVHQRKSFPLMTSYLPSPKGVLKYFPRFWLLKNIERQASLGKNHIIFEDKLLNSSIDHIHQTAHLLKDHFPYMTWESLGGGEALNVTQTLLQFLSEHNCKSLACDINQYSKIKLSPVSSLILVAYIDCAQLKNPIKILRLFCFNPTFTILHFTNSSQNKFVDFCNTFYYFLSYLYLKRTLFLLKGLKLNRQVFNKIVYRIKRIFQF